MMSRTVLCPLTLNELLPLPTVFTLHVPSSSSFLVTTCYQDSLSQYLSGVHEACVFMVQGTCQGLEPIPHMGTQ